MRRFLNDRWRNLRGYSSRGGTWHRSRFLAAVIAFVAGAGACGSGSHNGEVVRAATGPAFHVNPWNGYTGPTTTTTAPRVVITPQAKPQATGGRRTGGCKQRSLDQIPNNEDPSGNPRAVNPSSGAGGLWQIIPSTWRSNGGTRYAPSADQATPEQQRAVAQKIYAEQGTRPWRASGC